MIDFLAGIDRFAAPWAFALLLVPALLVIRWAAPAATRVPAMLHPAQPRAARLAPTLRARLAWLPAGFRLAALVLLTLAIARPQEVRGRTRTSTEGIAMQLVVDRSGSMADAMLMDGRQVRRIDAVKQVATEFITGDGEELTGREGDLIGMIAFGTYADTIAPLVREHDALIELIDDVEVATTQSEGQTAIGEALALAAARLKSAEEELQASYHEQTDNDPDASAPRPEFTIKSKAVVLMTDGVSNTGIDPLQAAAVAEEWGVRVYAIGIGGARYRQIGGMRIPVGSGVDESTLQQIAQMTGGRFWLADSAEALREIYAAIDELETTEIQTAAYTNVNERFAPFAAAALALALLDCLLRATLFRRLP